MLIISRRKGERIALGNDVEIVVKEIGRGSVKIGISAPAETLILRSEVRTAVELANRTAADTANTALGAGHAGVKSVTLSGVKAGTPTCSSASPTGGRSAAPVGTPEGKLARAADE